MRGLPANVLGLPLRGVVSANEYVKTIAPLIPGEMVFRGGPAKAKA